jgi:FkbM family methyltransferase
MINATAKNAYIAIKMGIAWRTLELQRYWFFLRTFRNGGQLARAFRHGLPCDRAVLWDGTYLQHPPGKGGFLSTLLEIWHEQVYCPSRFYAAKAGDCIIDAGANIGLFSVWMARMNPGCRVVAIEPFAENFAFLQENLRSVPSGAVVAYPLALGGRTGPGVMMPGGNRSLDHRLAGPDQAPGNSVVNVVTLKELLQLTGASRVALLKVDIEGSEYETFDLIDPELLDKVDRIAVEFHEHIRPGVLAMLRNRLQPMYHLEIQQEPLGRYGLLLARRVERPR